MADYLTTDTELTSVANAIRTKGGTSSSLVYPTGFVSAINAISTGTDVSDTTAVAGDVLSGKYFYTANGTKTQGTIVSQAAQTITPTTTDQTIASGKYLTGTQTIKGDANLIAENIKKDVTIFGVTGTHEGGGGNVTVEFIYQMGEPHLICPSDSVISETEFNEQDYFQHQTVIAPANSLIVGYFFRSSGPLEPAASPIGTNVSVTLVQEYSGGGRNGSIRVYAFNLSNQNGTVEM